MNMSAVQYTQASNKKKRDSTLTIKEKVLC